MIVGLASPGIASSLDDGLDRTKRLMSEASAQGAEIVCFPEAYLPGLRGQDFEVFPFERAQQERVLRVVGEWASAYAVAAIVGMERLTDMGRQIAAVVIDARGRVQGYQTKNQLDPSEDRFYVPGGGRRCAAPRSSFIPSSPAAIEKEYVLPSGAQPEARTTRRR